MIKKISFFLFLFSILSVYGQSKQITIDWFGATTSKSQQSSKIENNINYSTSSNTYSQVWKDDAFVVPNSLVVSNLRFQNVSVNDLTELDLNEIPNEVKSSIQSSRGRYQIYTTLSVTPIINDNGSYRKLISFDVSYSKSSANRQSTRSVGLTNSLLNSGQWYRFKIDQPGVYKIDRNFLNSLGMDMNSIDPRKIKIYGNGGRMLPLLNSELLKSQQQWKCL